MADYIPASEVPIPSFTSKWHNTSYSSISPSKPSLKVSGKNIFITGGGSGIGARTVQSFAEAGAKHIGILGRRQTPLQETKQAIQAKFPDVEVLTYNAAITDKEQVDAAFSQFVASAGKIDVLIHNAGNGSPTARISDVAVEAWMDVVNDNIKGTFLVTQAFLRSASAESVLVYVTSIASVGQTVPGVSAYSSSKAAAVRFMECVKVENPGVRVVSVHPGLVDTDMSRKAGSPKLDDVSLPADFMVWLASSEAEFTKGKFLYVNWDVDEMKARAEAIAGSALLELWIDGLPRKN